jgi:hypothetical protein
MTVDVAGAVVSVSAPFDGVETMAWPSSASSSLED